MLLITGGLQAQADFELIEQQILDSYKILEMANFDFDNLTLITVNREKKTPKNLQQGLDIERVPTFIFYKEGEEIGRYVEYAVASLEEDMLKIVSGQAYEHAYYKNE